MLASQSLILNFDATQGPPRTKGRTYPEQYGQSVPPLENVFDTPLNNVCFVVGRLVKPVWPKSVATIPSTTYRPELASKVEIIVNADSSVTDNY